MLVRKELNKDFPFPCSDVKRDIVSKRTMKKEKIEQ